MTGEMERLPQTMRVPQFAGGGRIDWTEKPLMRPGPGELLLSVRANAVCGSERGQFFQGSSVVPGHEAAGIVVAAGPGTTTEPGTPGVVFLMDFCGVCRSCRAGATNQCTAKRADMGFSHDGGYAPYERVSERIFFQLPDDLPLDEATMLLDVMGTGGHAIERGLRMTPWAGSVAIAGAGPIGLGVAAMARILLGRDLPIVISDGVAYRRDLATKLGATAVAPAELTDVVRDRMPGGADLTIDTSGKGAARQALLGITARRGALVCVGHGEGVTAEVSRDLIGPERSILGSEYFCYNELPANLSRLREHRAWLGQIITHRMDVREIQAAFDLFFAGDTGKVIVTQEA